MDDERILDDEPVSESEDLPADELPAAARRGEADEADALEQTRGLRAAPEEPPSTADRPEADALEQASGAGDLEEDERR
jgi:hypothetical protein